MSVPAAGAEVKRDHVRRRCKVRKPCKDTFRDSKWRQIVLYMAPPVVRPKVGNQLASRKAACSSPSGLANDFDSILMTSGDQMPLPYFSTVSFR